MVRYFQILNQLYGVTSLLTIVKSALNLRNNVRALPLQSPDYPLDASPAMNKYFVFADKNLAYKYI